MYLPLSIPFFPPPPRDLCLSPNSPIAKIFTLRHAAGLLVVGGRGGWTLIACPNHAHTLLPPSNHRHAVHEIWLVASLEGCSLTFSFLQTNHLVDKHHDLILQTIIGCSLKQSKRSGSTGTLPT